MSSDDEDMQLPSRQPPGETRETLPDGRVRITTFGNDVERFARRCVICSGLYYEGSIARHFDACFTAHSPSTPSAVIVRQPMIAAEPQRALFGTIFDEDSQADAWRFRPRSLRRSVYMSALPVECLLSLVGPTTYGRLSQVSIGWRDVTRTAQPLRQWHHEQSMGLQDRLLRGEHCTCASLVRQLAEGASREACGKAAVALERGLALREVEVRVIGTSGRRIRVRLASRGADVSGVLLEATVGDAMAFLQDIEGASPDHHTLYCRTSNRALRHMEAPLIVAWGSGPQINLELSISSNVRRCPCFRASWRHWQMHIWRTRDIVNGRAGSELSWKMEASAFTAQRAFE